MKIVFACGGTAGHINPAIAVANYIKARHPDAKILFIGNPKGMEARLVPEAGFAFAPVEIKGIQRKINWHNFVYNVSSVGLLTICWGKIKSILEDFQPDLVMGTGGYVSGPVLKKAANMGFKTITHESNAFPGVTTKLVAKTADRVLLALEEAREHIQTRGKIVVTGTPVREEILFANREIAREKFGIGDRICLLSFGGSLGAERINRSIAEVIAWHSSNGKIHHIHATGSYGTELVAQLMREKGINTTDDEHIDIREYIKDMADCLAAADIVICRSGAMTITEVETAGCASILIPSPNVAENHQYHNAMAMQKRDAAIVIEEKDLSGELLCKTIAELAECPDRLRTLRRNAQSLAIIDANDRIYKQIIEEISDK